MLINLNTLILKHTILFISILVTIFMQVQRLNNVNEKKEKNMTLSISTTLLDSLHGNWISIDDSLNTIQISGRSYTEWYRDLESPIENYRIYFSDTLVKDCLELDYTQINIDTLASTGKYLIKISYSDSTVWCYEFNGFNSDTTGLTFSISDTWAKRRPTIFTKQ
jgi:uncharacterized membrane protein